MIRFILNWRKIIRHLFENKDVKMTSTALKDALDLLKQEDEKNPFDEKVPSSVYENATQICPVCPCKNFEQNGKNNSKTDKNFDIYLIKNDQKSKKYIFLWVVALFIPIILLFVLSLIDKGDGNRDKVIKKSDFHRESCSHCYQSSDESTCYNMPYCNCFDPCDNKSTRSMSNHNHHNNHEYNVSSKYKEKDRSIIDLFLGLSAIVLTIAVLVAMIIYLKYLKKVAEKEFEIDNSILEYNKRVKMDRFRLDTARENLYNQYIEQKMVLNKRARTIKQDEIQQYLDHLRKCDMKDYELKNAYLNRMADLANKMLEVQKVYKKENTTNIDAKATVTFEKK